MYTTFIFLLGRHVAGLNFEQNIAWAEFGMTNPGFDTASLDQKYCKAAVFLLQAGGSAVSPSGSDSLSNPCSPFISHAVRHEMPPRRLPFFYFQTVVA